MAILEQIVVLFAYLNAISLPLLWLCLFVAIATAAEIGLRIGRRMSTRVTDKDAGIMATASLGLLALLIAFTYSMALARYDARRSVVLEEANAIGSTANFALMLPQADQSPILDMLRQYTRVRLDLGVPFNDAKLHDDLDRSNTLLGKLWQGAVAVTAATQQSLPAYRYVASLNEMNNIAEKRITALRNHVPVEILIMLAATALIGMGFTGYAAGVSGVSRRVAMAIMSALIAFLVVVTQDLARPDRGAIEVSTQALEDTLAAIPSPVR